MVPPDQTADGGGSSQEVHAVNGFAYGVVGADLHVFANAGPVYLLLVFLRPEPPRPQWLLELPSRLLNARHTVVDFTGRDEELEDLRRWRADESRLAVRWLHGPGGQGKTRLADEAAQQAAADGWLVAVAVHGPGQVHPPPGSQNLRPGGAVGILLLVDYADRWPLSHVTWLLSNALLHNEGMRTRVLLLARTDHVLPALRASLEPLQAAVSVRRLSPIDAAGGARLEMFAAARRSFASRYGLAEPAVIAVPGMLDEEDLGLTLAIHMAALVAVDAFSRGHEAPDDLAGLTLYLLDREHLHWENLYLDAGLRLPDAPPTSASPAAPFGTPPGVMNQVVFLAALIGAQAPESGRDLVARLLPFEGDPERVLADHAYCYPPETEGMVCEPIYPDRLAEDFLALTLSGHCSAYPTHDWAARFIDALLARAADDSAPPWLRRAMSTLAAAATRWPHVGDVHLYPLLSRDPRLAVEAGGDALTTLATAPQVSLPLLGDIEPHLPRHRHLDLDGAALAIALRLADTKLGALEDPAERAHVHADLGYRLNITGRREESLAELAQAVAVYRDVGAAHPDEPNADLAHALGNLCHALLELGRREEALDAAEDSAALYRRLAAADPQEYNPDLAYTLNTLGTTTASLGRHEEAVAACDEATSVYRRLVASDPAEYEADLAGALGNTAIWLDALGHHDRALALGRESRECYERLAAADPDRYLFDLAAALTNEGASLDALHRYPEAVEAMTAAVDLFRRLAEARPASFEHHFATALANLSQPLGMAGRTEDALRACAESLGIRRRLAAARPEVFEPDLATALNNYSVDLLAAGRVDEARAAVDEAVEIRRRLADADPAAFDPFLASALTNQGSALLEAGRAAAAAEATGESAAIYRRLSLVRPEAYREHVAASLHGQAKALVEAGRSGEALEAATQAVGLYRALFREDVEALGADLASGLITLASALTHESEAERALTATEEAIALYERLALSPAPPSRIDEILAQAREAREALLADRS